MDYADDRPLAEVPRTTDAAGAVEVARATARRVDLPAAFWGMVMFVASEGTLFGCFIGTYFYLRFRTPHWPPDGLPAPAIAVPVILVCVLAATSLPMALAARAAKAGRIVATRAAIALALFVQCGYIAYEMKDYADQLGKFGPTRDAYASIYYVLLGADHAHVWIGIVFDVWLLWKLAFGFTTYRVNAVVNVALYWHVVNAVTLAVIGTLLSANA